MRLLASSTKVEPKVWAGLDTIDRYIGIMPWFRSKPLVRRGGQLVGLSLFRSRKKKDRPP